MKLTLLIVMVCLLFISFVEFKYINGFIFSLDLVPIATSLLIFGYILRIIDYKYLLKPYSLLIFLVLNILFCILNYKISGLTDIYNCAIGNVFFFSLAAYAGIVFSLLLSNLINTNTMLEYIGKNSLVFYAFQNSISLPISTYLVSKLLNILNINCDIVYFGLTILLTLIILTIISIIINKKFPFIIAKKGGIK